MFVLYAPVKTGNIKIRDLSRMAKQYLCLPATSSAVDRLITSSGVMNGDLRKKRE